MIKFTLCIPTMNRFDDFLKRNLPYFIEEPRIDQIIICDENGADVQKIAKEFHSEKLLLVTNTKRLGCLLNKMKCMSLSRNEWICLMDSDNFPDSNYFTNANKYIEKHQLDKPYSNKNVILSPCFAIPKFCFHALIDRVITKNNLNEHLDYEKAQCIPSIEGIETLMNHGNYIINKCIPDNLDLSQEAEIIPNTNACDVIFFNTLAFEQLNLHFHIVAGLEYYHTQHDGSIYWEEGGKTSDTRMEIYKRFNRLSNKK